MKVLRDYACHKCKVCMEDILEYGEYPDCPECGKPMVIHFTQMHFGSYFPGSHNAEYTTHGRKFNGCSKESLLKSVSKKKRIAEGRKKKGHCDIEDIKEEKK